MASDIIVNTSVDDLRSSVNCMLSADKSRADRLSAAARLKKNVEYEKGERNRTSVIKILVAAIKKLEKI